MPVYKDEKNGSWYAMVRFEDWKSQRKQKCKRGFATKREAQEWSHTFQQQNTGDLDMTFEAFCELYEKDMRPPPEGKYMEHKGAHHPRKAPALLRKAPCLRD